MTGKLITIEGIEGVGKSTAMSHMTSLLESAGHSVLCCREPGGTAIAEKIREVLLMHHPEEAMTSHTELLLMFASRAQLVETKILPALKQNQWVLCDRFVDASFAYQGGGRQIPTAHIDALQDWILGGLRPDLTILLDAPVEIGLARARQTGPQDRIEQEEMDFFERVRDVYLARAKQFPEQYRVIDATQPWEAVQGEISEAIKARAFL